MASWFTRVIDRITPWDRGGEAERRRKREEERSYNTSQQGSQQAPRQTVHQTPTVRQPQNVFDIDPSIGAPFPQLSIGLTNIKSPVAEENRFDQAKEIESKIPKPKQGFWNKIRDQFDANTEADQYRRKIENLGRPFDDQKEVYKKDSPNIGEIATTPIRSALRVTTGIGQGASGLYDLVTPGRGDSRLTRKLNTMAEKLDKDAKEQGLENLYKVGNVVGEIGSYFTPGIATEGGKVGQFTSKLGDKFDDIIRLGANPTRTRRFISEASREYLDPRNLEQEARLTGRYLGQDAARGKAITPRVVAENVLQSLGGAFITPAVRGINRIRMGRAGSLADEVVDTATSATGGVPTAVRDIENLLSQADIEDIMRTDIPVRQGIDIQQLVSDSVPINVRTPDADRPIIRELAGDAPNVTQVPTRTQAAEQRAANRFRNQDFGVPDDRIEGVTPRTPEVPYQYDAKVAATTQDDLIDQYAGFLRDVGEGNGTQLVPDGEGGYIRTSNNVRFGDTKGKRMTKDMWREEAERQLRAGKADPAIQREFDDATNPEIQSLLARGEQAPVEDGRPIKVQQVDSIPVQDRTDVPVNLPETPGTVRATTATAPAKTEAKLVAETQPPTPRPKDLPKSEFDEGGTLPTTQADEGSKIPSATENDLRPVYERVVENLREQRKAYKSEKKLRKADFNRRKANYGRIYEEARASGKSSQEAEQMARAALGGEYTKGATANFEIDPTDRNKLFDRVHNTEDNLNTKKAFEHLFDAKRTEPLRDWERTRIRRFIQKELGADEAQQLDELIAIAEQTNDRSFMGRVADFMTSSIAAGDVSAAGRQGLPGLINHPRMSKQAWSDALKALKSEDELRRFATKLSDDPYVAFIQEKGGQHGKYQTLTDVADEARGASTDNRLTSWYVNPSNRHYNVYLDSLRHQQKKAVIDKFGGIEGFEKAAVAANPENPDKWMQAWFKVIDRQSGRGTLVKGGGMTAGDVQVLFSARNLASKFQRLASPLDISTLRANPQAYLRQLKETGIQTGVLLGTLGILNESGIVDVENGKIKIGPTRVDITGGFATMIKAANDIRKAIFDSESQGVFDRSGGDVVKDYFQNQLSPLLGTVMKTFDIRNDDGDWKDKYGNPIDAKWLLDAAPMPAVAKTFASDMAFGLNPLEAGRNAALSAIGFNTNTYMSAEDKDNAARAETADQVNSELQKIAETGLLSDKMIADIDDEDVRDILTGKSEKQLSADEFKKVRSKLTEGITSSTGADSDSAYRQRGEYDKDLAALRLKREMIEAEPNPKPSDIKGIDIQIKRSELLQQNEIPFELLEKYQKTGVEDWRDLEETNPELFQQLWALDEMMAKEGVGYKSGSFTEQKYYQKTGKGGSGGSGGGRKRSWSAEFGKITGNSPNAPKVKEYQTMDQAVGKIPYIKRTRPNIVHTIREGRL